MVGKYDVFDKEYSSQNYLMERLLKDQGVFEEKHVVDNCLLLEMHGKWLQEKSTLLLTYGQMRSRKSCHDSLPEWAKDSAQLKIPIRNIVGNSYESLLAASGEKPSKWIRWNLVE